MIDYSRYTKVKVEKKDKVAILSLNRPDALNTLDTELHLQLEDVLDDLNKDAEVSAVVITGEGKAFSAGGDLRSLQKSPVQISLRFQKEFLSSYYNTSLI